jgi:hypothetical protein
MLHCSRISPQSINVLGARREEFARAGRESPCAAARLLLRVAGPFLIDLPCLEQRGDRMTVDLAMKLNMLALGMAFAFIGAVLVGAF